MAIGRKGRDFFRNRNAAIASEYIGLNRKRPRRFFGSTRSCARDIKTYTDDTGIDKVFLIYNEFKSVLSQRVVLEQLLPVSRAKEDEPEVKSQQPVTLVDYIYEQPPEEMFSRLLPRLIETQIFRALLESVASEQGARMTAMDSASKNASELIEKFDTQHESHSSGGDHQRDHRSRLGCSRTVTTKGT
jgi:F-type H+-transporting ATPase subunit gamma